MLLLRFRLRAGRAPPFREIDIFAATLHRVTAAAAAAVAAISVLWN